MIKTIHIEYDWWKAEIQINENKINANELKEILSDWLSDDYFTDDILADYLRFIAPEIIDQSKNFHDHLTKENIAREVIKDIDNCGFGSIDGSNGILLTSCDAWTFEKRGIKTTYKR